MINPLEPLARAASAFLSLWQADAAARGLAYTGPSVNCEGCGNLYTDTLVQPCYACRLAGQEAEEEVAEDSDPDYEPTSAAEFDEMWERGEPVEVVSRCPLAGMPVTCNCTGLCRVKQPTQNVLWGPPDRWGNIFGVSTSTSMHAYCACGHALHPGNACGCGCTNPRLASPSPSSGVVSPAAPETPGGVEHVAVAAAAPPPGPLFDWIEPAYIGVLFEHMPILHFVGADGVRLFCCDAGCDVPDRTALGLIEHAWDVFRGRCEAAWKTNPPKSFSK